MRGTVPSGDIKAQGFRIIDKGDTIIFTGNADMLLNGARKVAAKRAPPACRLRWSQLPRLASRRGRGEAGRAGRRGKPRRGGLPAKAARPLAVAHRRAGPEEALEMPATAAPLADGIGQIAVGARLVLLRSGAVASGPCARSACPAHPAADDGPIRIQADSGIEWQQNQQVYIARGNAVAARGNSEVQADTLIAHYREKAGPKTDPSTETIRRIGGGNERRGRRQHRDLSGRGRSATSSLKHEAQTVIGDRAVYDIDQGIAVVTGKSLKLTTATDVVTARDSLEWYDQKQIAVARGDAVAIRTGKTIKADILTAYMAQIRDAAGKGARAGRRRPPDASPTTAPGAITGAHPRRRRAAQGRDAGGQEGKSRISRVDAQGHVVDHRCAEHRPRRLRRL